MTSLLKPTSVRARLTLWYIGVLTLVLTVYLVVVFVFQYGLLASQIYHAEIQDVETTEGLLFFDRQQALQLRQDYYTHPQSHLLVDRLMEVRTLDNVTLYRTENLGDMTLGGQHQKPNEGESTFNERTTRLADGTWVLMISHRHPVAGRMLLIRLGYSLSPLASRMEHFLLALLLALPLALIAAGFAGSKIARRALEPLNLMALRAEQINATNLSDRLHVENEDDELGRMARVFNSLFLRLERSFAQLQRFTADAAHELKTPLASLRAVGEHALSLEPGTEGYRDAISSMLEETARLNQTVEGLLLISRAEAGQMTLQITTFPLRELMDSVIALLEVVLDERHITFTEPNPEAAGALVLADRTLLRTSILNVIHNAAKFSPVGSTITATYDTLDRDGRTFLRLSVADQGPGIAPEDQQRVFERFYRIRAAHAAPVEGAGLGLAIAHLTLHSMGGAISFDPTTPFGALCHLEIPTTARES